MEISLEKQLASDFDWFCVDDRGEVGHFAHAGFKKLPQSVAASREDREFVTRFFNEELNRHRGHTVDPDLRNNVDNQGERYLHSFVAMADKGLYSFDIASYLKPKICYFRVALPVQPIVLAELPEKVQEIVNRTKLFTGSLSSLARIPYDVSLQM